MGFKLNYLLDGDTDGAGNDLGITPLALPYNQQTNITDAKALIDDINLSPGAVVVSVIRYIKTNNSIIAYTGTAGTAFPITPGESLRVQMSAAANYIIVGSHDPGLSIDLLEDKDGVGNDLGINEFAVPYHTTLTDAKGLIDELNLLGTTTSIIRYIKTNNSIIAYTGTAGTAFPLVPGEGLRVQIGADVLGYVPSHF